MTPGQGNRTLSDDDDMRRARPQFILLSEAEVWKAIAEDAGGSVGAEVTRLVAELTVRLMARAEHGPEQTPTWRPIPSKPRS